MSKKKEPAASEMARNNYRPFELEPDLARKSNKIRASVQHLLSTIPATTLWNFTPKFLRNARLKFRARREAASGQVTVDAETGLYQSPSLNTMLEEEEFHVRQSYEQWGSVLDEIESTIRPYVSTITSLRQSEAAANARVAEAYEKAYEEDRPAYAGMGAEEVSDARAFHANKARAAMLNKCPANPDAAWEIENARYQIHACGLADLYFAIVGDADGGGYALERSLQVQNNLKARQELWISWAGVRDVRAGFPRIDVGVDSDIHRRFCARYERVLSALDI